MGDRDHVREQDAMLEEAGLKVYIFEGARGHARKITSVSSRVTADS